MSRMMMPPNLVKKQPDRFSSISKIILTHHPSFTYLEPHSRPQAVLSFASWAALTLPIVSVLVRLSTNSSTIFNFVPSSVACRMKMYSIMYGPKKVSAVPLARITTCFDSVSVMMLWTINLKFSRWGKKSSAARRNLHRHRDGLAFFHRERESGCKPTLCYPWVDNQPI